MAIEAFAARGVSEAESLIETRGISMQYARGPRALDEVNIRIHEGERIALIGTNGSGKSTLLKCLVGLERFTGGTVIILGERFEGEPDRGQRRRLRRQSGFVFQQHGLVRRSSALTNVIHGALDRVGAPWALTHAIAPATLRGDALDCLRAVGLADNALARVDSLSGGQQQRIAIARALIRKPRLFIADEPAASLDPAAGQEVMALFSRLAVERGGTLIWTTHDMDHALGFSDRVIALGAGRVVLDARTDAVDAGKLASVFRG